MIIYVLDGEEFPSRERAREQARSMAFMDTLTAFNANDSVTKEEFDSHTKKLTRLYEQRIEVQEA